MHKPTLRTLSQSEQALVAETERANLAALDEDGLAELLTRVRRARDKYVKMHRREAAARVSEKGSRGAVSTAPRRSAAKAEVFEEALARVSKALGKAAAASAALLRDERIAAARGERSGAAAAPRATPATKAKATATRTASKARSRTPVEKKTAAATSSAGRRRQAARDAR